MQVFALPVLQNTRIIFFGPPTHKPAVGSIGNIDIP